MNFADQAEAFRKFAGGFLAEKQPEAQPEKRALVLVLPWMETAVPWFAMAMAMFYRSRGRGVTLLLDDLTAPNRSENPDQLPLIAKAANQLRGPLEIISLSALEASSRPGEPVDGMDGLCALNEAYLDRTGVTDQGGRDSFRNALESRVSRLRTVLSAGKWDHVLLPGGIYSTSGLTRLLAAQLGIRTACYDSGAGSLTLATDAIAGHCMDLAKIFDPEYEPYVREHWEDALRLARKEFDLRKAARDRRTYQVSAYRGWDGTPFDIVLPMNVFDDSAALGRNRYFKDAREWILETVGFVLDRTRASIVVREHPGARRLSRPNHFGQLVQERFGGESRFRFVGCREEVNTYALIEGARLVLPHSSTVGVEAAMMGKQVLLDTGVYYGGLGFVERGNSKEDYFLKLKSLLEAGEALGEERRERAWVCYFYGQVCNFVLGPFTPQPVDFKSWVLRDWKDLMGLPVVQTVLAVLGDARPSWRIQSEQVFKTGRVPSAPAKRRWWQLLWGR